MKKLTHIIVHCSDSDWGSAAEITKWHQQKGWKGIGYHFVVMNGRPRPDLYLLALDGSVEVGRTLDASPFIEENEVGAHALGYNDKSIGICLIGKKKPSAAQSVMCRLLIVQLMNRFGILLQNVLGHYETEKAGGKTCPNFDMKLFREEIEEMRISGKIARPFAL